LPVQRNNDHQQVADEAEEGEDGKDGGNDDANLRMFEMLFSNFTVHYII